MADEEKNLGRMARFLGSRGDALALAGLVVIILIAPARRTAGQPAPPAANRVGVVSFFLRCARDHSVARVSLPQLEAMGRAGRHDRIVVVVCMAMDLSRSGRRIE